MERFDLLFIIKEFILCCLFAYVYRSYLLKLLGEVLDVYCFQKSRAYHTQTNYDKLVIKSEISSIRYFKNVGSKS